MNQETYPELKRKSTFGGEQDYLGKCIQEFIDTYKVDQTVSPKDYVLPIRLAIPMGSKTRYIDHPQGILYVHKCKKGFKVFKYYIYLVGVFV